MNYCVARKAINKHFDLTLRKKTENYDRFHQNMRYLYRETFVMAQKKL